MSWYCEEVRNTFHRIPNTSHDFQNGGLSCDNEITAPFEASRAVT